MKTADFQPKYGEYGQTSNSSQMIPREDTFNMTVLTVLTVLPTFESRVVLACWWRNLPILTA